MRTSFVNGERTNTSGSAKLLALSATETEFLRDVRSRLNRVRVGTPAEAVLSAAFFKACERGRPRC